MKQLCTNPANLPAALFLVGSIVFTIDGVIYLVNEINLHAVLYTLGSVSFALGSALMFQKHVEQD